MRKSNNLKINYLVIAYSRTVCCIRTYLSAALVAMWAFHHISIEKFPNAAETIYKTKHTNSMEWPSGEQYFFFEFQCKTSGFRKTKREKKKKLKMFKWLQNKLNCCFIIIQGTAAVSIQSLFVYCLHCIVSTVRVFFFLSTFKSN